LTPDNWLARAAESRAKAKLVYDEMNASQIADAKDLVRKARAANTLPRTSD
jgi:hypothetical protein